MDDFEIKQETDYVRAMEIILAHEDIENLLTLKNYWRLLSIDDFGQGSCGSACCQRVRQAYALAASFHLFFRVIIYWWQIFGVDNAG